MSPDCPKPFTPNGVMDTVWMAPKKASVWGCPSRTDTIGAARSAGNSLSMTDSSPCPSPCRALRALNTRADDQDDVAIDKRHDIYYDDNTGTMAAVNYFKGLGGDTKVISVDGQPSIQEVSDAIMKELG